MTTVLPVREALYTPQHEPPRARAHRGRGLVVGAVVIAAAVTGGSAWAITSSRSDVAPTSVSGQASSSRLTPATAPADPRPATSSTPSQPATPVTPSFAGVPAAAVTAITHWETVNGPTIGTWQIGSAQPSAVDANYVLFKIIPAPRYEGSVQGGYGFAQNQAGEWSVIGFGSALVGCPGPGVTTPTVPAAVLTGFGFSCPTS